MADDDPGRLSIDLFCTLDWVAQAPGGPDEDPSGGFAFGGWQAPLLDPVAGAEVAAGIGRMDALLLGRRTYEIFAAYWPEHVDGADGAIGIKFRDIPKYVATRGHAPLDWVGTSRLGPDLAAEVAALKRRHRDVHVIGSVDLAQTLIAERLFDELRLWVHPIVLGRGKKVFRDSTVPANLTLLADPVVGTKGTLFLRYGPGAAGVPRTGDMSRDDLGL